MLCANSLKEESKSRGISCQYWGKLSFKRLLADCVGNQSLNVLPPVFFVSVWPPYLTHCICTNIYRWFPIPYSQFTSTVPLVCLVFVSIYWDMFCRVSIIFNRWVPCFSLSHYHIMSLAVLPFYCHYFVFFSECRRSNSSSPIKMEKISTYTNIESFSIILFDEFWCGWQYIQILNQSQHNIPSFIPVFALHSFVKLQF